jgi:hypothetical protein
MAGRQRPHRRHQRHQQAQVIAVAPCPLDPPNSPPVTLPYPRLSQPRCPLHQSDVQVALSAVTTTASGPGAASCAGKHVIAENPRLSLPTPGQPRRRSVRQGSVLHLLRIEVLSQFRTSSPPDRGLLGSLHYGEIDYYHGIGPWYCQFIGPTPSRTAVAACSSRLPCLDASSSASETMS